MEIEGFDVYKIIYSELFERQTNARKLLSRLVGAVGLEPRPPAPKAVSEPTANHTTIQTLTFQALGANVLKSVVS